MRLRNVALFMAMATAVAQAQTPIPAPVYTFAGDVLGVYSYSSGEVGVPAGKVYNFGRVENVVDLGANSTSIVRSILLDVYGTSASSASYGMTTRVENHGIGLANGDYVRVFGGTGPNIAHKTAVRGDANQWAVWNYQINMGPGAKAALWIGGDNPEVEGRGYDTVPNVIVVNNNLQVTGAVIQWNARTDSTGRLLKIFNGNKLVFEVTADGIVRAKRFEQLP